MLKLLFKVTLVGVLAGVLVVAPGQVKEGGGQVAEINPPMTISEMA